MSTQDGRPLTRRQLRELRQTGQNAIITDEVHAGPEEPAVDAQESETSSAAQRTEGAAAEATEERLPDAETTTHDDEHADDVVTLDVVESGTEAVESVSPPLTRRQLREQERQRTGAAPIIAEQPAEIPADEHDAETVEATIVTDEVPYAAPAPETPVTESAEAEDAQDAQIAAEEPAVEKTGEGPASDAPANDASPTLRPGFGEDVVVESIPRAPASFDELLTHPRESSGSGSAPSALILDEIPTAALNSPINATGELIVTSSHKLPEGFGSSGAAKGTTDGREIDAVLIDGEIPLASSPTPIAASNAVSTSKSPGEVIRPPAPEKNHKLVLTLGITAGALGIAVVGAVVIAYASGVFG